MNKQEFIDYVCFHFTEVDRALGIKTGKELIEYVFENVSEVDKMFGTSVENVLKIELINAVYQDKRYKWPDINSIKDEKTRLLVNIIWTTLWPHVVSESQEFQEMVERYKRGLVECALDKQPEEKQPQPQPSKVLMI